jgi:cystathionine beta-lyase
MSPPLYQTATFKQPSATENGPFDYTRSGNPTRDILQANMAELEGGVMGLAFCSGMAAINAAVRLLATGERALLMQGPRLLDLGRLT